MLWDCIRLTISLHLPLHPLLPPFLPLFPSLPHLLPAGPTVYFPSRNAPSTVNVGENLTVTCDATSGDNPVITSITIFLEDEIVASSTTSDMLSYTFEEPELSDNGTEYLCSAVNALGTTNATFSLTVRGEYDFLSLPSSFQPPPPPPPSLLLLSPPLSPPVSPLPFLPLPLLSPLPFLLSSPPSLSSPSLSVYEV